MSWSIDIAEPALWWPRQLGDQPLVDITAEIVVDGNTSDIATRRTGLREVAWNDWTCSVNGERLFLKGANLLPARLDIANATEAECRRDIEIAADLGLDMVRVHGHIARRSTYDAADELGILVMQDFPLQWGYQRSVRGAAIEQATAAVDELGHHPSIVQWSAHNDPNSVAIGIEGTTSTSKLRYIAGHQLPNWNKTILDRWVKRTIERADPTRLVSPHSGVLPHLPLVDGTDSHFYFGWYHGEVDDLEQVARRVPRVIRFVSEFGAQAVPDDAEFIDEQLTTRSWPDLDWEQLARRHGLQKWVFDQRVAPADFDTLDSWRDATQRYQSELLKYHIELLRRHKYRPAGGFTLFSLNDASPMVSWSLYDHERRPKLAAETVRNSCAPVIVTMVRPPSISEVGSTLELSIVVVNDLHEPIEDAVVDVVASWVGGERRWRFGGRLDADEVIEVATVTLDVPDVLGRLNIDLALDADDVQHRNHYSTAITRTPAS